MNKLLLKENEVNKAISFLTVLVYGIIGSCLILEHKIFFKFIPYFFIAIFAYNAFRSIIKLLFKKDEQTSILNIIVNIIACGVFYFKPGYVAALASFLIGAWNFLLGIIHFINAYQYKKNQVRGVWLNFFNGLISIIFGIYLMTSPFASLGLVRVYAGFYFLFYALIQLTDFIHSIIPTDTKDRIKQKIRIPLPTIIVALIPTRILSIVNKSLAVDKEKTNSLLVATKKEAGIDLEIYIHISQTLLGQMGHVDIGFGDKVYSYGNYDDESYYLFGVAGDGVMEVIDRIAYINFCIDYSKKMIVAFGVTLSLKEQQKVSDRIKEIFAILKPWEPKVKRKNSISLLKSTQEALDYASELYAATNARFYKFTKGKYKTYFGFNTNCVRLADDVLKTLDIPSLNMNGIITPGTYYEYLNDEFRKENSIVVKRTIYNQEIKK